MTAEWNLQVYDNKLIWKAFGPDRILRVKFKMLHN